MESFEIVAGLSSLQLKTDTAEDTKEGLKQLVLANGGRIYSLLLCSSRLLSNSEEGIL